MPNRHRSFPSGIMLHSRIFFRKFPAFPYLLRWTFISLLSGICIGTASAGFLLSLEWATYFREQHLWTIALLPVAGFTIALLYHYLGKDIEPGNNLLIDTLHNPKTMIPFRMAPLVFTGTIVTHLFGGSAGREGTAIQMAGAVADRFSKLFRLPVHDRQALVIAAIAGGFGSVFGTPISGAVFGLEFFLVGRLRYDAIYPAFMCAIVADTITRTWGVHHTIYPVSAIPVVSIQHILYAIIAGIAFGWCAAAFSKSIHFVTRYFRKAVAYAPLRAFAGGTVVALGVFLIGDTKYIGLGIPEIENAFRYPLPVYDFAAKMVFTIVTLAAGFKGGEVTPLFFIGATLGNVLALFLPLPQSLLAGMGFVAVFAGATNTPLACTIMAMELFGTACGTFVGIACVVSYLFSGHNSIYGSQIIGEPKHKRFSNHRGKKMNEL